MLTKICSHCGKKIKINEVCECQKQRHKEYDKYYRNQESKAIYHSKRWLLVSQSCRQKCNGLDLYEYFINNRIVKGALSHHIIELTEDKSRAYDQTNLIFLSNKSHKKVHFFYKKSEEDKKKMQTLLFAILNKIKG